MIETERYTAQTESDAGEEQTVPEGWKVLYSQKDIEEAVENLVANLLKIKGIYTKKVILIQVLESARVFTEYISKGLEAAGINVEVQSIKASSYNGLPGKRGDVQITGLENISFSEEDIVLVVDDMVDSGATMKQVLQEIQAIAQPGSVFSVVLLEKICSLFKPNYAAITDVPDRWLAGFGINGNAKELGEGDGRPFKKIIAKK